MFESSILNALQNDTELTGMLACFSNSPAIFSDMAPEEASTPYLTFRIDHQNSASPEIAEFALFVDYWGYGTSRVDCRKAMERVELVLDRRIFEHERYSTIRVFSSTGGTVAEEDKLVIHYNQMFTVRASRKKWMDEFERSV